MDLGDGQTDTVIGEVKVLDGSQYAGFKLATASDNNDNQYFEVNDEVYWFLQMVLIRRIWRQVIC